MDASRAPRNSASSRGLFNTNMGPLQRQLRLGEYNLLKCAAMFESDFVQVSKQGGILDVHNQVQQVRVAIAATSPGLLVPDVLLLARPVLLPQQLPPPLQHRYRPRARNRKFELTRLLPLCFVKISIHDLEKKQLRFKMSSATQGSEEREISIAEVLSALQEEIQDSPGNPMEFLDSPSVPPSPSPTLMAIQERPESPLPSEAQSSQEQPWKFPQERKGSPTERSPTSRKIRTSSKSSRSRRSHSSRRAASRAPSKISSFLMGSFSSSSQTHPKSSRSSQKHPKSKDRKRRAAPP